MICAGVYVSGLLVYACDVCANYGRSYLMTEFMKYSCVVRKWKLF